MPRFAVVAIRSLTIVLGLLSVVLFTKGASNAWLHNSDDDLQTRLAEYASFLDGVYPDPRLASAVSRETRVPSTVYPPYALPMFAVFFAPFGLWQGRLVVELLSLGSLIALGTYGYRLLGRSGPETARLGGVAAAAIWGNLSAMTCSQFTIPCIGAILVQIIMLERRRPVAAGVWWALGMLKPQIGLAFALLFLIRGNRRGLACGLGILAVLVLAACWWTRVSPLAAVDHWAFRMNVQFAAETSIPGRLAEATGLPRRAMHLLAATVLLAVPLAARLWRLPMDRIDPLLAAAVAAILGTILFYHRVYDQIMLFPLLFASLSLAADRPTPWRLAIAAAVALCLWMPQEGFPMRSASLVKPAVWTASAVAICVVCLRDRAILSRETVDRGECSGVHRA